MTSSSTMIDHGTAKTVVLVQWCLYPFAMNERVKLFLAPKGTELEREIVRRDTKWGLLPPQRQGIGLAMMLLAVAGLVVLVIVTIAWRFPSWGVALLLPSVLATLFVNLRTRRWLAAQVEAEQMVHNG